MIGFRNAVEPKKVIAIKALPSRDKAEHNRSITEIVVYSLWLRSSGDIAKFSSRFQGGGSSRRRDVWRPLEIGKEWKIL